MSRVILSTNVTLDGFMAGPNGELDWHFANWNKEIEKYAFEQLKAMGTILAGRVTYQSMGGHFSSQTDEFSQMMNALPKIVFSKTLEKGEWNNSRIVKGGIAEEIGRLKQQPGKDMIMWGGVSIVHAFIQQDLIDEYRFWVNPVILGSGKPLFKDMDNRRELKLRHSQTFGSVVLLCYEPNREQPK